MTTDVKDLVERLRDPDYAGPMQHLRSWSDLDRIHDEASAALEAQAEEIARRVDESDELRHQPWPEWASKVLAVIRSRSGYDGYDDALDGVDLPAELEETMAALEQEADRQTQEARAALGTDLHKSAADHYRKETAEHRARAEAVARERDALAARVAELEEMLRSAREDVEFWGA
jgi:hypothetical protein